RHILHHPIRGPLRVAGAASPADPGPEPGAPERRLIGRKARSPPRCPRCMCYILLGAPRRPVAHGPTAARSRGEDQVLQSIGAVFRMLVQPAEVYPLIRERSPLA